MCHATSRFHRLLSVRICKNSLSRVAYRRQVVGLEGKLNVLQPYKSKNKFVPYKRKGGAGNIALANPKDTR